MTVFEIIVGALGVLAGATLIITAFATVDCNYAVPGAYALLLGAILLAHGITQVTAA